MEDTFNIPTLDLSLQAIALIPPVLPYGSVARSRPTGGTRHFYVSDHQFTGLWARPDKLLLSGCSVVVEPNYSTRPGMPRWQVLADIGRKRTLARYWQSHGLRVLVDMNVDPLFRDLAFLGVPRHWRAYSTRSHRGMPFSILEDDYRAAMLYSESESILFAVFGGGKRVRALCESRGWTWVPEHSHVVRGLESPYGPR